MPPLFCIFKEYFVHSSRQTMKYIFLTITLLTTLRLNLFSQNAESWLFNKINSADTILLVSHEETAGIATIDKTGKYIPLPKLVIKGNPNYNIIKEKLILNNTQIKNLSKILIRPFKDSVVEAGRCFIPHHAIFLIKNKKLSYIDICFGCRVFETSRDLKRLYKFEEQKWAELENFFINLGFKYNLIEEKNE